MIKDNSYCHDCENYTPEKECPETSKHVKIKIDPDNKTVTMTDCNLHFKKESK